MVVVERERLSGLVWWLAEVASVRNGNLGLNVMVEGGGETQWRVRVWVNGNWFGCGGDDEDESGGLVLFMACPFGEERGGEVCCLN